MHRNNNPSHGFCRARIYIRRFRLSELQENANIRVGPRTHMETDLVRPGRERRREGDGKCRPTAHARSSQIYFGGTHNNRLPSFESDPRAFRIFSVLDPPGAWKLVSEASERVLDRNRPASEPGAIVLGMYW